MSQSLTIQGGEEGKLIDEANDSHIPIQITGKRGNAVLVSEEDWRAISETMHLNAIPDLN